MSGSFFLIIGLIAAACIPAESAPLYHSLAPGAVAALCFAAALGSIQEDNQ